MGLGCLRQSLPERGALSFAQPQAVEAHQVELNVTAHFLPARAVFNHHGFEAKQWGYPTNLIARMPE